MHWDQVFITHTFTFYYSKEVYNNSWGQRNLPNNEMIFKENDYNCGWGQTLVHSTNYCKEVPDF